MGLNAPEWQFVLGGCVAAVFTGALQPCFAILFSEIMGVRIDSAYISCVYHALISRLSTNGICLVRVYVLCSIHANTYSALWLCFLFTMFPFRILHQLTLTKWKRIRNCILVCWPGLDL